MRDSSPMKNPSHQLFWEGGDSGHPCSCFWKFKNYEFPKNTIKSLKISGTRISQTLYCMFLEIYFIFLNRRERRNLTCRLSRTIENVHGVHPHSRNPIHAFGYARLDHGAPCSDPVCCYQQMPETNIHRRIEVRPCVFRHIQPLVEWQSFDQGDPGWDSWI